MRLSLAISCGGRRVAWIACGVLLASLSPWGPLLARAEAPGTDSAPTHKQTQSIACCASSDGMKLEDFCAAKDGRVLALVSPAAQGSAAILSADKQDKVKSEVRVFEGEGKQTGTWKLDFHGQAINVGPDGSAYVGGAGRVAQYDMKGKRLAQGDAPQAAVLKDPEKLRAAAEQQLKQERELYQQALESMKQNVKSLEEQAARQKKQANAKPAPNRESKPSNEPAEKDETAEEEALLIVGGAAGSSAQLKMFQNQVKAYQTHLDRLKKKTVDDAIQDVMSARMAINAIAAGDHDVYVACRAEKGYGYDIWKTDLKFAHPQKIVTGLTGCCGQMDIQASGDEVWVAENSKHRVVKFDREGKQLLAFGKRDREGAGEGFGGCCNPMNLCFDKAGDLLVSESNGVVKHFDKHGKYVGLIGTADVRPGCKNSAVGVTPDGKRVFYIDINNSKVIVLSRTEDKQASAR